MKVYVYEKKDKHKRFETINNACDIMSTDKKFYIITTYHEQYEYDRKDFMISVYGY